MIKLLVIGGVFPWLANLAVGFFVFWKNPRKTINRKFFLFSCSIALWSIGSFVVQIIQDLQVAIFAAKICYLSACFLPILFLDFAYTLTHDGQGARFITWSYLVAGIFALFLFFSPHFYLGLRDLPNYHYRVSKPGPIYYAYFVYFCLGVSAALYVLLSCAIKARRPKRDQYLYVFIAYLIAVVAGLEYFLTVFGFLPTPPIDDYVLIFTFSIMAYAIIRHRLMDIEIIIKRTLIFAGIVASSVFVVAFPFALMQVVIGRAVGMPNPYLLLALGIATAVLIYRPVERYLVNITDRYLFQKKYNYHRLLKENSKRLALIKSLDEMARQIVSFLVKQGRIRNAGIFVQSPDQKCFDLKYPLGYGARKKRPSLSMDENHPLIKLLVERKTPLVFGKLEKEANIPSASSVLEEVRDVMKELKAEVIIPSFLGGDIFSNNHVKSNEGNIQLRNLLVLGPKKSDEDYTDEDLDVFFTIAQDSAIAAENARLFDTVIKEREAKVKAEHLARRAKFAGLVKHEIKSKLTYIDGPARDITRYYLADLRKLDLKELSDEHEEKEFRIICEKIEAASNKITVATDRVLLIAQTASAGINENDKSFQELDLRTLWEDSKEESGLRKRCDFESNMPEGFKVYGNYHALLRTLVNLITNAWDAMKDQDEPLIKLRCSYENMEEKRVSYFEVEDSGCGIPSEVSEKIFEEGFSTKPKPDAKDLLSSGLGQGLAACKLYIEGVHNGKLWFESEAGKGTTFKFWIPMKGNGESSNG